MSGLLAALGIAVTLAQPAQPAAHLRVMAPSTLERSAHQGQLIPIRSQTPRSGLLTAAYVSFIGLEALDVHSTLSVIRDGGREANPVLRGAVHNPAAFIAIKAAGGATAIWATERLRRKHPRGAFVLMVALNSVLATVVAHNYSLR